MHHRLLCKMFVWQGLVKDFIALVGTDPVDVKELLPFSGCVVQEGLSKVAVYKDGDGNLDLFSGQFFQSHTLKILVIEHMRELPLFGNGGLKIC